MVSMVLQMNLFNALSFADRQHALESARVDPPDYVIIDIGIAQDMIDGIDKPVVVLRGRTGRHSD